MNRIGTHTADITQENIDKLLELFPQVGTEVMSGGGADF